MPEQKKQELMRRAWILSSTSLKEGFGLVVLEAAASGTPAVVYKVAGFKDSVIDKKTGILCQENTPENLAENIIKLINDSHLYQQLQQNAWQESKKFNFDKTTAKFEEIITSTQLFYP